MKAGDDEVFRGSGIKQTRVAKKGQNEVDLRNFVDRLTVTGFCLHHQK